MTAVTAPSEQAAERSFSERLSRALPLLLVFTWFALLYAWQAWSLGTPWLFTDELEFTQLARSFAENGETARRGVEHGFVSLYVFLVAPAWLLDSPEDAYETAKFIGALAMTATIFPAYGLARVVVSRPYALFAAAATVAIPAMYYSSLLISETVAYPYATLCFFLVAKALAVRRPTWLVAASVATLIAPLVRSQLAILPATYALAAVVLAWGSEPMRQRRATWSRLDLAGVVLLMVGAAIFFSELIANRSTSWDIATRVYKGRLVEFGVWAAGALTIGIGVLPVVVAVALLATPSRDREPRVASFRALLLAAIATFWLYTGIKAAYLSTVFAERVVERNLIYVAPLLFCATALWLERHPLRPLAIAFGTLAGALLLGAAAIQLDYPYFEAPGFSLLAEANRTWEWSQELLFDLQFAVLGVAAMAILAFEGLRRRTRRGAAALAGALAVAVLAWNVAGELSAARASRTLSDLLLSNLPPPLDWVDRETGGARTLYLAQSVTDATGIHELEFWNRSVQAVWSLDGTAPGPGPTATPDVVDSDGRLSAGDEFPFAIVEPAITVRGALRQRHGALRLYRVDRPLRVRSSVEGVYGDGWTGERGALNRFGRAAEGPGQIEVRVSREGWGGPNVAEHVAIFVGRLGFGEFRQPRIEILTARAQWRARSRRARTFVLPTPPPPFRVEVWSETFVPSEVVEGNPETRRVGVQVAFRELGRRG